MSAREGLGLLLLVVCIAAAPLAYFVGAPWGWLSLVTGVAGAVLFFTSRVSKRLKNGGSGPDAWGELKGFPGHRIFRDGGSDALDDD